MNGKTIVHNYGHCGYGIMSSPGSSMKVGILYYKHSKIASFRANTIVESQKKIISIENSPDLFTTGKRYASISI